MPAVAAAPRSAALNCHRLGHGPATLMLHSSSGSGSQWRPLVQALGPRRATALVVDLHGHGISAEWPMSARDSLAIDADGAWRCAGLSEPVHLVGHAYGGAVALQMALMQPSRVASLTLYEPVPFGLLRGQEGHAGALDEVARLAQRLADAVSAGQLHAAARLFCDYWAGGPAWEATDDLQRLRIALRMPTVVRHFNALFAVGWSAQQLQRLRMPTLLVHGGRTRAPARAVGALLANQLPCARSVVVAGAGHLGPLTHAEPVAALMARQLRELQAPSVTLRGAANDRLAA